MRKLTCPNFPNTHKKFTVSATERCSWEVDDEGNFERVLETYDSEAGDDYVCMECGHEAEVEYVNNTRPEPPDLTIRGMTLDYVIMDEFPVMDRVIRRVNE